MIVWNPLSAFRSAACPLLVLALLPGTVTAREAPPVPDFTRGDSLEPKAPHDWNLGPTGARGWVYSWKGASTASRQILITSVDPGSPADGVLQEGDVILGVGAEPFSSDARICLAKSITRAEAGSGRLSLMRWRSGTTDTVALPLDVLGSYAATAPYECEKSDRIFEAGCEAIAKQLGRADARRGNPIVRSLNAMALLGSGDEKYLPLIREEARWAGDWEIREGDLHSWAAGWVTLFLAEYTIATGDRSHFAAMERLCREIAAGQSHVGTWGHRFAYRHNGILRGYGAMNQVGLSLTTAMMVAREAGVRDPSVHEAIERSARFLRFYVGKGAIPYGDHHPWLQTHDDNGKASAAIVLFDLLQDREAVEFFGRMGVSSYGVERETGHTGNFFNMLWALPGISRLGSEATGAWIRESAWLLDLARTWDGRFDFLGKPGATGGEHQYGGWDCTGAYLLGYAVSRKALRFAGKTPSVASSLSRADVGYLIEEGRGWAPDTKADSYQERTVDELLNDLASWSPVIRERAALALAGKEGDAFLPRLVEMLEAGERSAQLGACAAFEQLRGRGAVGVPALSKLLASEEYWMRAQAAEALAAIGEPARVAIPELLQLVAAEPDPADHRGYLQRYLAFALFDQRGGLMGRSLESVDRELLREAARAILKNEDGRARGALRTVYRQLSPADLEPLLPAILEAVVEQAPSGVMFSDGIRLAGLEILAEQRIAEGLPLCIDLIELDRWGSERRLAGCLRALQTYGGDAKAALGKIREFAEQLGAHPKFLVLEPKSRRHNAKMAAHYRTLQEILDKLDREKAPRPLRTLARS